MPSPSTDLVTLRPDLAGGLMEIDLEMNEREFIGQQIFPFFPVPEQSGRFGRATIESLLRTGDTKRASRGGYQRGDWEFTDHSFATKENGWEEPVDERDAKMYANYFDFEEICAMRAHYIVMEGLERRIASLLFSTDTYTPTTVTNEWDDWTNATPVADVEAKVQSIHDACGIWPNTMVLTKKVFRNLRHCDEIIERLKYNGIVDVRPSQINKSMLETVFDLDNIIVGDGMRNTADAGQPASLAPIWSTEYAWIGKTATNNDLKDPCVGRTFHWAGDGSATDGRVETYQEPQTRADIVRVRMETDENMIYPEVGGLLDNITTTEE